MNWFKTKVAAPPDLSTPQKVLQFIQANVDLEGYGSQYVLFRDNIMLPPQDAKNAIGEILQNSGVLNEVYSTVSAMVTGGDRPDYEPMAVTFNGNSLTFDYFKPYPLRLPPNMRIVVGKQMKGNRATEKAQQRQTQIKQKLDQIHNTPEEAYMMHANQCGFLLRNTQFRFFKTPKMAEFMDTASMETIIRNLQLERLHEFLDAAGQNTLLQLQTHLNEVPEGRGHSGIYSPFKGFAAAIIDFLNLEYSIDLPMLMGQFGKNIGDTKYQSIESFGGTRQAVLEQLKRRRGDLNPKDIEEYFNAGYAGELL